MAEQPTDRAERPMAPLSCRHYGACAVHQAQRWYRAACGGGALSGVWRLLKWLPRANRVIISLF